MCCNFTSIPLVVNVFIYEVWGNITIDIVYQPT